MKTIMGVYGNPESHWVGDGFPVRSLFSYNRFGQAISPFLLLDFAGPAEFTPSPTPRGVGEHPHRGFETVTIVYDGEVAHRDSTGKGGVIGPGDVQWMTAARGILHEEFHSPDFSERGGAFRMIQLWVNLPARHKLSEPGYQSIRDADIPAVALPGGAGTVRVIAGEHDGHRGPARTFTPINVWNVTLAAGKHADFDLPEGHVAALVVVSGEVMVNGAETAREADFVLLDRAGSGVEVQANGEARLLLLSGEPIDEPIAGHGPFVMNSEAEIREAIDDFNHGRFGRIAA
ncbi:MAG: pirin family protein [Sphingomonadaceae bacterium]|nr:pirin family protein [Sphingomonadaceae bacterium]